MTYYDTYIGRLKRPDFNWSDRGQELQRDNVQFITNSFWDGNSFTWILGRIISGTIPFRQLDWGTWAIPATKQEILDYMDRWGVGWDLPDPGDQSRKPLQRAACLHTAGQLSANEEYVLVTEEF